MNAPCRLDGVCRLWYVAIFRFFVAGVDAGRANTDRYLILRKMGVGE
jgi:hypothetical protein